MADRKKGVSHDQMKLFKGIIDRPNTSEEVADLPDIAVGWNLFSHGNAKRVAVEGNKEHNLTSAFAEDEVNVRYSGPCILGKPHEVVFTELTKMYQDSGIPIHEYMQIPYAHLTKLCNLKHGTGNMLETKRRLFDLRHTVVLIADDRIIDELISNWDALMQDAPEDMVNQLRTHYEAEIAHCREIRKKGKNAFLTMNLVASLAGEDSEAAMLENLDDSPVNGSIGVRLDPLLTLLYTKDRNIYISKAYRQIAKETFTIRLLYLLKMRSIFYDRYIDTNFLAWFMPPDWTGFRSKQDKSRTLNKIIASFKEVERLGQIADGVRFVKYKKTGNPYDAPNTKPLIHSSKPQLVYKVVNVERLYPAVDARLVHNDVERDSPLFRLVSIFQATKSPWGLRPWKDDHILEKNEYENLPLRGPSSLIPLEEIFYRLKDHPHKKWQGDSIDDEFLLQIIRWMEELKRIAIISHYELYNEQMALADVEFVDDLFPKQVK